MIGLAEWQCSPRSYLGGGAHILHGEEAHQFQGLIDWWVFPLAAGTPFGKASSDLTRHVVVEAFQGMQHSWGNDPAFAAVEEDSLGDGLVKKTHNTGLDASAEEHAGKCCPFLAGLLNVFVDCWPVALVGGHDAFKIFEGGDLLQWFTLDGNDCGVGSSVAGVSKTTI